MVRVNLYFKTVIFIVTFYSDDVEYSKSDNIRFNRNLQSQDFF